MSDILVPEQQVAGIVVVVVGVDHETTTTTTATITTVTFCSWPEEANLCPSRVHTATASAQSAPAAHLATHLVVHRPPSNASVIYR